MPQAIEKLAIAEKPGGADSDSEGDALALLLAPLSKGEFFASYWGKAPLFTQRGDPSHYQNLFTLEDFDRALAAARGNSKVGLTIIAAAGSDRGTVEGQANEIANDLAFKRFVLGDTVRLMGVDRVWPAVADLCLGLGESLGAEVHANAYLTPAGAQGFSVHFDHYDVLILQVAGAKDWFVYAPDRVMPVNLEFARAANAKPESEDGLTLLQQPTLRAGDLLYMPRGFYHKALTADTASLHLTLSINPLYWAEVVLKAVELMTVEIDALRQALPPGALQAAAASGGAQDPLRSLFLALAERADLASTARALLERRFAGIEHPPDGHFADLARAKDLRLQSRVGRRSGIPCAVECVDEKARIRIASNSVQGPAAILPALEFVAARSRFRVADLPGLSDSSKVVLTRRLILEGLLKINEI
jgi:hypothetical protein